VKAFTAALESLGKKSKVCKGMHGIIEEGQQIIPESKDKDSPAKDLALIAAAQKVEQYWKSFIFRPPRTPAARCPASRCPNTRR
jgi:Domain of unknown function (DUF892)